MNALPMPSVPFRDDPERLEALIHQNSDWIWEVDQYGRYTFCSEMVSKLLGRPKDEVVGRTPFDFMPPDEAERVRAAFAEIVATKSPFSGLVNRNVHSDGRIVVLETSGIPLFDTQGQLVGYRGIDRDISALGERVLHLEAVYETAPIALFTVGRNGRIVMANRAMGELVGAPHAALAGRHLGQLSPIAAQRLASDFVHAEKADTLVPYEFALNGRWIYSMPQALKDVSGAVAGFSVGWLDITARKKAEAELLEANLKLEQYVQQDYLTGLTSRRHLDERLALEIERSQREQTPLSVCMVDVDYFKAYNDALSHLDGDECLRGIAGVLAGAATGAGDVVSRYGGEEFVIVLPNTDEEQACAVAERTRAEIAARQWVHPASPFRIVTVSAGVTTYHPQHDRPAPNVSELPQHGRPAPNVSELLRLADRALYAAKQAGRNTIAAG